MKHALTCLALALMIAPMAQARNVVILGEVHDNPAHHAQQAAEVRDLQPAAVVFEMLTPEQAGRVTPELRDDAQALAEALGWSETGWPDFRMYHPIFTAAPDARVYGGHAPRRVAMQDGVPAHFGAEAERYGLTDPLPDDQQATREALQQEAHCNALPESLLPAMVDIQRLRDAVLARAVVQAVTETGGPVAVITGNGHARRDWGITAYLARVAPELEVRVIGQTEEDAPLTGEFDEVLSAPAVDRPDPCEAFAKD